DEWAFLLRDAGKPPGQWGKLAELADRLDASDTRREVRRLVLHGKVADERRFHELVRALLPWATQLPPAGPDCARLRELAGQASRRRESPLTILSLARALQRAGDRAGTERLLQWGEIAWPEEVILRIALARFLYDYGPARVNEVIECLQAARA